MTPPRRFGRPGYTHAPAVTAPVRVATPAVPASTDAPVNRITPTGPASTPRPVGRPLGRPGFPRPAPVVPIEKPDPPPPVEDDEPEPPPIDEFDPEPMVITDTEIDDSPPVPARTSYQRPAFEPKPLPQIDGDMTPEQRARLQRLAVLHQILTTASGGEFLRRIAENGDPAWELLSEAWCNDVPF
ncbi:hypothetical protein [Lichenifustis flavocetrariae]|uniref:Uncharacterized protein n=1 Tax=Lichenifustis flavocetrariae TaxID=2949735 RepID=A0AA41Z343_9HYPH|nr:hypothetical protein [Lichenifustis flavocetrariae]MCW6512116.1 hypothetical protein [Lichenifustis flavocetrariae]